MMLCILSRQPGRTFSLPSFLRKRQSNTPSVGTTKKQKATKSWNKDIVCLPKEFAGSSITIPRGSKRTTLAECGLIGKVHLTNEMSEEDVKCEIRSVFGKQMKYDPNFPFTYLQSTGGGTKTLTTPPVSVHFQWTAQQVVRLAGQGSLYILAEEDLELPVSDNYQLSYLYYA